MKQEKFAGTLTGRRTMLHVVTSLGCATMMGLGCLKGISKPGDGLGGKLQQQ